MSQMNLNRLLSDIRIQCQHIVDSTERFSQEQFENDLFIRSGFERFLPNVGEAAVALRTEFPREFEQIPGLTNSVGLRNRLAHGYETDLDVEVIWHVKSVSIPRLMRDIDNFI